MTTLLQNENKPIQPRPNESFLNSLNLSLGTLLHLAEVPPPENSQKQRIKPLKRFNKDKLVMSFEDGIYMFDKKNRCKVLFHGTAENAKTKLEITRLKSREKTESEEDVLNVTDSFQYRTEPLVEEEDLMLDVTPNKALLKKTGELDLVLGLWLGRGRRNSTEVVKSKPKMRRKSDTSMWSGGVSELERKTFFWTFEYIAKPIDNSTNKDLEKNKPSLKLDGSPMANKRFNQQIKLKQWSKMALEGSKDFKDDAPIENNSSYLGAYLTVDKKRDMLGFGDETPMANARRRSRMWGTSKLSVDSQCNLDEADGEKTKSNLVSPLFKSRSPNWTGFGDYLSPNKNKSFFVGPVAPVLSRRKANTGFPSNNTSHVKEGNKSVKVSRGSSPTNVKGNTANKAPIKRMQTIEKLGQSLSPHRKHRRETTTGNDTLPTRVDSQSNINETRGDSKEKDLSKPKKKKVNKAKVLLRLHESLINKIYNQNNITSPIMLVRTPSRDERILVSGIKSPLREKRSPLKTFATQMQLPRLNPDQGPIIHREVKSPIQVQRIRPQSFYERDQGNRRGKMSASNIMVSPVGRVGTANVNVTRGEKDSGISNVGNFENSKLKIF